jgi:hypothetical protein
MKRKDYMEPTIRIVKLQPRKHLLETHRGRFPMSLSSLRTVPTEFTLSL